MEGSRLMRSGGQLLVDCLIALGARVSFGIPGESYLAVLDALHDTAGELDFTICRNEGGAAFMAAAYGKLTGSPGICFVTRGPGATNASIGIHTARQDSSPLLVFVGQVGTEMKGREAFQELDYRAVFGSLAKWAVEIEDVARLPEIVSRAWATAMTGRPGPVVIALPENVLSALTEQSPLHGPPVIEEAAPTSETFGKVSAILKNSKRPVVLMGGCNWSPEGRASLTKFAEASGIPVLAAFRYQDQFDNFSSVYCGEAGVGMPPHVRRILTEADAIFAVNIRFGEMVTDGYTVMEVPTPKQRLIHVHAAPEEIGKIYAPHLGIPASHNAFSAGLSPVYGDWSDWLKQAQDEYHAFRDVPAQPSPVDMAFVMRHLEGQLPDDAILSNGAGNFAIWPNKFFRFCTEARLLAPQSGAMGYGLPAAIAAKRVHPERTVVCFAGDGDFQMNLQELATATQYEAQPIVLILNNGIYGTIRAHQERYFPGRVSGTDMVSPDFAALAKSYGFHGERVETTEEFPDAFARALASKTGAVLDLNIAAEAIAPRQTISGLREASLSIQKKS